MWLSWWCGLVGVVVPLLRRHPLSLRHATLTLATNATNATNTTNTGITDDTTTNATVYPTWVTANTGNLPQRVTSTKLTFNPSTGVLTSTGGISGGSF